MFFGRKKRRVARIDPDTEKLLSRQKTGRTAGSILRRVLYRLILLSFLGVIFYSLFFSPWLAVSRINISGTETINSSAVKEFIGSRLEGKYLNLISKNNIILISEERVGKTVLDEFKRAKEVRVSKKFPETLEISIIERKYMLVLCSNSQCFIIDDDGLAFSKADFESDELKENELLVLNNEGNKEINIGNNVLSSDYIQYLLDIKEKLKSDLAIDLDGNYKTPQLASGDIRVKTSEGWMIYFNKEISIQKEIETLKVVLNKNIEKDKRKDLEYIDLRTNNRIYYKFR